MEQKIRKTKLIKPKEKKKLFKANWSLQTSS